MTTAIEPAGTRPDERGRPDHDERRTGAAATRAAEAAGRTADEETDGQAREPHEATRPEAERAAPRDGSIGQHLPAIPRAARPAVAGGRKRLRSMERPKPAIGVVVALSLAVLATVALVFVARSRRRSAAEELMTRLERVPGRLSALDV